MKDVAKYVPGIGWMFYFMEFPIVKRNWNTDRERLAASCKNLANYPVKMLVRAERVITEKGGKELIACDQLSSDPVVVFLSMSKYVCTYECV